jgi:hypothetical protein
MSVSRFGLPIQPAMRSFALKPISSFHNKLVIVLGFGFRMIQERMKDKPTKTCFEPAATKAAVPNA